MSKPFKNKKEIKNIPNREMQIKKYQNIAPSQIFYNPNTIKWFNKKYNEDLIKKSIYSLFPNNCQPIMTEEEWRMFSYGKPFNRINYAKDTAGKHFVRVYFAFEPYHDVTYSYCVDDGCIYENRMYIGE